MCQCLSFLMPHPLIVERWIAWRRALRRLCSRIRAYPVIFTSVKGDILISAGLERPLSAEHGSPRTQSDCSAARSLSKSQKMGRCVTANGKIYPVKVNQDKSRDQVATCSRKSAKWKKKEVRKVTEVAMKVTILHEPGHKLSVNGGSRLSSLFTRQGRKGLNQDAMLVWENFVAGGDTIFCGVFDGHGPDGHLVARNVRDKLPLKLASCWQTFHRAVNEPALSLGRVGVDCLTQTGSDIREKDAGNPHLITSWKDSFLNAYKMMDRELLIDDNVDCVWSGTTAVTLVKQGNDLIVGNVGDSRAVLGTRSDDNSLLALQLTIDMKPNLPKEAERIKRLKGRVFAFRNEPSVKRVWLPHHNTPGLAMSRALGDYSLKNFGVISEPQVTYRQLTAKDKFVVLATDGVWDVLSNEQVVEIVASVPVKSLAAKVVVDTAVHVWRSKNPTSKVDDCAVVCLFLNNFATATSDSLSKKGKDSCQRKQRNIHAVTAHSRQMISGVRSSGGHGGVKLLKTSSQNRATCIIDEEENKKLITTTQTYQSCQCFQGRKEGVVSFGGGDMGKQSNKSAEICCRDQGSKMIASNVVRLGNGTVL